MYFLTNHKLLFHLIFACEITWENSNLKFIIREDKLGLDTAHKYAYDYAIKNGYEKLITMDADLSHDPKEILTFINLLDKNELGRKIFQ